MDRYTRWVRHGENIETVDNTENSRNIENIVRDESEGDSLNLDNDEWDVLENENVRNVKNIDNVESQQLDERVDERHIEFRSDGVPIGDNASKFVNYLAILVRDRVPCTIQSWKNVNVELKNEL
jgi:hypothetical protein